MLEIDRFMSNRGRRTELVLLVGDRVSGGCVYTVSVKKTLLNKLRFIYQAGAHGRDTRGLLRQHQFMKVAEIHSVNNNSLLLNDISNDMF